MESTSPGGGDPVLGGAQLALGIDLPALPARMQIAQIAGQQRTGCIRQADCPALPPAGRAHVHTTKTGYVFDVPAIKLFGDLSHATTLAHCEMRIMYIMEIQYVLHIATSQITRGFQ